MSLRSFLWICAIGMLGVAPGWGGGSGLDLRAVESLPIQDLGRKKPFYTFATEALQSIHGRSWWRDPGSGERWRAVDWAVAMWVEPAGWEEQRLILVDYLPLKEAIGLPATRRDRYFSFNELAGNEKLRGMLLRIQQRRQADPRADLDRLEKEVQTVGNRLARMAQFLSGEAFAVAPAAGGGSGRWMVLPATVEAYGVEVSEGLREAFEGLARGYRERDQARFDAGAGLLGERLAKLDPESYADGFLIRLERMYKAIHPFRVSWMVLLVGLVALLVTWTWKRGVGYGIAWGCVGLGLLFQVGGYVARVMISGRAPVTNMYETVTWLAFAVLVFAAVFEGIYRARFFFAASIPVAVVALILTDSAPAVLDRSIQPLTPVLQSNFWLTTHVLTINTSYAAFALAMAVGHIALVQVVRRKAVPDLMYTYIYRVLQIGVLLLAAGTILGGVWANYSWGRFWDWDPKETWALISLLCYLIMLHGRIAGWWGGFGLAMGSILAFQSILMAWYGVNFVLGAGLHSYGFGTGGFPVVATYTAAEVLFCGWVGWKVWQRRG
ncbi:MAG: cytochrome c biogenesis protein CcsA, partial [Verrucomicrobiia bacterium]